MLTGHWAVAWWGFLCSRGEGGAGTGCNQI